MADYKVDSTRSFWQPIGEWLTRTRSTDIVQARRGRLLAAVLLFTALSTLVVMAVAFGFRLDDRIFPPAMFLLGTWAIIFLLNRRGVIAVAGTILSGVFLILAVVLVMYSGPVSPNALTIVVPVILAGFFGPPFAAIVMAILAGVSYLALNVQANPAYLSQVLSGGASTQTLPVYANLAFVAVIAWLVSRTANQALQESRQLSLTLVEQRREMEVRLQLQTRQLQATTTVARAIAGTRDLDKLLEDTVRLVRETFGYYHVQVFLTDESSAYAVLRQSTGEVGKTLLERGHRLPIGSLSVIGQVTASGRPVIARDTDTDFVHRRNELLPLTRSEMALPLSIGERVIGALDMQSVEPNAFDDEMFPTFQALADQLAIAIENARLFEQAEDNLRELRELSHEATQRSWADFLAEAHEEERRQIFGTETKALAIHRSRVIERVLGGGSVIVSTGKDGRKSFLAAPIVVRDEVVGVLGIEPDEAREWSQDDLLMIQSIAGRTALAIENARLYLQAQRAAEREHLINTIAARLQRAPSLAMLLETATKELAEALGTENVYAEISMEQPFAQSRKQVSDGQGQTSPPADAGDTGPGDLPALGESEEARASQ